MLTMIITMTTMIITMTAVIITMVTMKLAPEKQLCILLGVANLFQVWFTFLCWCKAAIIIIITIISSRLGQITSAQIWTRFPISNSSNLLYIFVFNTIATDIIYEPTSIERFNDFQNLPQVLDQLTKSAKVPKKRWDHQFVIHGHWSGSIIFIVWLINLFIVLSLAPFLSIAAVNRYRAVGGGRVKSCKQTANLDPQKILVFIECDLGPQ